MAHQAYQPVRPCVSKYLQYKWDHSDYDMHRRKVSSAKATISRTPPKTYNHLINKTKKKKLQEDRISIIERDNHMLLEKISHIMRTTGRVDHKNDYINKRLSSEKRQKDLLQITEENLRILERLTQCGPHYSVQQWREDWVRTTTLMESIRRYPQMKPTQSVKDNAVTSDSPTVKSHEHTEPCARRHGSDTQEEMKTNNQQSQQNVDIADQETNLEQ